MKRIFFILLCVLMSATAVFGETLVFSKLKENETIVIGYRSSGCFHWIERQYRVIGGDRLDFTVFELKTSLHKGPAYDGPPRLTGNGKLSNYESFGLDAYLFYLRGHPGIGSTTIDEISFGYYRDGIKIGEEQFEDGSSYLSQLYLEKGRVVNDEDRIPKGLSLSAFRAIVPPWLIEARLEKEAQPPEPTVPSALAR